jgi:copper chaperone CopZ
VIGPIDFVVEQAGCESCAARVKTALGELLAIDEITVDEGADVAVVRAHAPTELELVTVDAALADASRGSGHTYRVSPGSWRSGSQSGQAGYA